MNLSIVIPCFNEYEGIPSLARRLDTLLERLDGEWKTELIFVDDGSADETYRLLQEIYRDRSEATLLRHERNRGLGAAIRTGMERARGRFVATIDSDCTYDPMIIPDMLIRMEPDVDVITASPYAPGGEVLNVAPYQIFISQWCSRMYRIILRSDIHTYTSMFRVYRRSALGNLGFRSNTFLSMAEILIMAIEKKLNVREYPATLSARQYGYSKRKIVRLTFEHLKLMAGIVKRAALRRP